MIDEQVDETWLFTERHQNVIESFTDHSCWTKQIWLAENMTLIDLRICFKIKEKIAIQDCTALHDYIPCRLHAFMSMFMDVLHSAFCKSRIGEENRTCGIAKPPFFSNLAIFSGTAGGGGASAFFLTKCAIGSPNLALSTIKAQFTNWISCAYF